MPLEIKLNLEKDADLRKEIRNLIKGQIKSITREELRGVFLQELVHRKQGANFINDELEKLLSREVEDVFKKGVKDYYGHRDDLHGYIKKRVDEEVVKYVAEKLDGLQLTLKGKK